MIVYSTVRHVRDNRPVMHVLPSWGAFADYLEGESKRPGIDKLRTLCISPAIYEDGVVRAKRRVAGWQWFAVDIDNKEANAPHSSMEAVASRLIDHGTPFVIYTTTSHREAAHCYRLMFPLNRIIEPDEFGEVWACAAQWLGCVDPATKDESRLFVAPRTWAESAFYRSDAGEPLDVDLLKLAHPVVVHAKPSKKLASAFLDTSGLRTPCPTQISLHGEFVTADSLGRATAGAKGTRMFPFLVRTGTRALLNGYAITADDLASIGRQLASSIGRDAGDVDHDAVNAHRAAVSRYAEIKAAKVERLDPLKARFDKWRQKSNNVKPKDL